MASKQITPRQVPRTAIKTLLLLAEPQAEIVIHADKCYLLSGDRALFLSDKIFEALRDAEWITTPQAIDNEHSSCRITRAGRGKAKIIKAAITGYTQMTFEDTPDITTTHPLGSPSGRPR